MLGVCIIGDACHAHFGIWIREHGDNKIVKIYLHGRVVVEHAMSKPT